MKRGLKSSTQRLPLERVSSISAGDHNEDTRLLDARLVEALLAGDEKAFTAIVNRYNRAMIRLAMAYVPTRAVAEEVAQDAWLAMVQGLSGFKGKSSLKTWLFGILLNRAKTKGSREKRSLSFSGLQSKSRSSQKFFLEDWSALKDLIHNRLTPGWGLPGLGLSPEDQVLSSELRLCLEGAIACLPPAQRAVLVLRDIEGWTSAEVCDLLGISPENQRVRLHRARVRVRSKIENYLNRR